MITPLQMLVKSSLASEKKYEDKLNQTFQALIERNADCNAKDDSNFSILHHAVLNNNKQAVLLLSKLDKLNMTVI